MVDSLGLPLWLNVPGQCIHLFAGLAIAAIRGWRKAGVTSSYKLATALRLSPVQLVHLFWAVPIAVVGVWSYRALQPLSWRIIDATGTPDWLGRFITDTHLLDLELPGHMSPVLLYCAIYVANVVGEELWWRVYVLPRQERAVKGHAWIVHGLMCYAFHLMFFWDMIPLLAMTLILTYVSQRTRSTWPALIAHFVLNGQLFLLIVQLSLSV